MNRTHRIHFISFQRIGESSYATLHPSVERMQPFMYELLAELVEQNETQEPEGAEDLA